MIVIRRLRDTFACGKFRQYVLKNPKLPEILESQIGMRSFQNLFQFLKLSRTGKSLDERREFPESCKRIRVILPLDLCAEPDDAQQPERVMFDADTRLADNPDKALLQVLLSVKRIKECSRDRIPVERIDRNITAFRVHLPRPEDDRLRVPAVRGFVIFAKGRHFKRMATERYAHAPEHL